MSHCSCVIPGVDPRTTLTRSCYFVCMGMTLTVTLIFATPILISIQKKIVFAQRDLANVILVSTLLTS